MNQDASSFTNVNETLNKWRQGDCVTSDQDFIYRYNVALPATEASQQLEGDTDNPFALETVKGFVVVSQTCDIIRDVATRPYVEISPLVEIDDAGMLKQIKSRARPRFVEVPALTEQSLVADLDRVMTIEKPVLIQWDRVEGCRSDKERRVFAEALARKRVRPALPDDFVEFLKPLQGHWIKKHNQNSDESKVLRILQEIRVQPSPSWGDEKVKVRFWFILESWPTDPTAPNRSIIEKSAEDWIKILDATGTRFEVDHFISPYSGIGADEYISSDRLDYDYLSQ